MKDETTTSLVSEVRIKLHIKSNTDSQVRNLWMCLNYDHKPQVSHIVEHIRRNFCQLENGDEWTYDHQKQKQHHHAECCQKSDVKLYLDDFWLPPNENSRVIRENDFIKVELNYDHDEQNCPVESQPTKLSNKNWSQTKTSYTDTANAAKNYYNNGYYDEHHEANEHYANEDDYYYHYYDDNDETEVYPSAKPSYRDAFDPFEFWTSNPTNESASVNQQAKSAKQKQQQQQQPQKETKSAKPSQKSSQTKQSTATAKTATQQQQTQKQTSKPTVACYKKFAVGNYAHMLNEEPVVDYSTQKKTTTTGASKPSNSKEMSMEEVRANHYQYNNKKSNSNDDNADFDRIASNVNSHGKQKWKNSTKQTQSNGPKHIIFSSSDSDTTSSSSSSSDSSDSECDTTTKQTVAKKTSIKTALKNVPSQKKAFYEPTKEEQLSANTKSLSEFKRVFNETKLNAPKAEEFVKKQMTTTNNKPKAKDLNVSISSTSSSSSSSSSSNSSPIKERKSPSSPKVDYEKLAKLEGIPRLHDKIAFQILEISSNFTPEVSQFKTGTVIDIDNATNEVTIKLNNKYNAVLKKPSKFSVVLDETEDDNLVASESEPVKIKRQNGQNGNDNLLKVDWRNLMNLKLMPEETKQNTEIEYGPHEQHQQQHQLTAAN